MRTFDPFRARAPAWVSICARFTGETGNYYPHPYNSKSVNL